MLGGIQSSPLQMKIVKGMHSLALRSCKADKYAIKAKYYI